MISPNIFKYNLCKLLVFFSISGFVSCQGQEKEPIKPEEMYTTEKFNIEEFNKDRKVLKKEYDYNKGKDVEVTEMNDTVTTSFSDGTKIKCKVLEYVDTGIIEFTKSITPPLRQCFVPIKYITLMEI